MPSSSGRLILQAAESFLDLVENFNRTLRSKTGVTPLEISLHVVPESSSLAVHRRFGGMNHNGFYMIKDFSDG